MQTATHAGLDSHDLYLDMRIIDSLNGLRAMRISSVVWHSCAPYNEYLVIESWVSWY